MLFNNFFLIAFMVSMPGKTKFCSVGLFPVVIRGCALLTALLRENLKLGLEP